MCCAFTPSNDEMKSSQTQSPVSDSVRYIHIHIFHAYINRPEKLSEKEHSLWASFVDRGNINSMFVPDFASQPQMLVLVNVGIGSEDFALNENRRLVLAHINFYWERLSAKYHEERLMAATAT